MGAAQGRPAIQHLPFRRNPFFTGREQVLSDLRAMLLASASAALVQPPAISGLGGIGKTQTAIEYAYRYQADYAVILWMQASSRETLIADITRAATLLHLPEQDAREQDKIVQALKHWLEANTGWLLIFDNADDLHIVSDVLPARNSGHILFTTRATAMSDLAQRVPIDEMDHAEGSLLLLRRAKKLSTDAPLTNASEADLAAAQAIVEAVDGLPLALDQAGAYIEETQCSLADYLQLYRVHLLEERAQRKDAHPEPVATTWALSFNKVQQVNPAATDLLRLCAFLAPDDIPEEMFLAAPEDIGSELQSLVGNQHKLNMALRELLKYSLLRRNTSEHTIVVHRLVQAVLRSEMDEETRKQWAERTVRAVNRVFPKWKVSNRLLCRRLFPQAQACFELITQWNMMFPEAAYLLYQAARYLRKSPKRYREAELFDQQALKIQEKALGKEHVDVAQILYSLAATYSELNKYEQSESLYRRAIAIREHVFGPQAPETLDILNDLGLMYYKQEKYDEAASLHQRCLALREQAPDAMDKIVTSTTLNNLALVYSKQGKHDEAEALYKRALEIREKVSGKQSINAAITLRHLAGLYKKQEKYEQAEPLYQQALAIFKEKYEMEDRRAARCLKDLADLYCKQGEYKKAEPLYQQALSVWKEFFGLDHLEAAEVLEGYADLLRKMRRKKEAARLEAEAKAVRDKVASQEGSH